VNTTTEASNLINELIQKCLDACQRLEAAANIVLDPTIKSELSGYSVEQQRFARDLNSRLAACGNASMQSDSIESSAPGGPGETTTAALASAGHPILAACERGEDSVVDTYRKALGADVPSDYGQLIESQYESIQHAHSRVKVLHHETVNNWATWI
jgi:uncharacterized protein (TIGR02284 family)